MGRFALAWLILLLLVQSLLATSAIAQSLTASAQSTPITSRTGVTVNTTKFEYDRTNRLTKETLPLGQTTQVRHLRHLSD